MAVQATEIAWTTPYGELDAKSYEPKDTFFGTPYIDADEWREEPYPHRHVHGGFDGCDTRFTFYFPRPEEWQGRMYSPLEGAHGGHEEAFGGPMGELIGGLRMTVRLGGYMSESNQGHIGDDIDPVGGEDPSIYSHRANTEAGRFSRHVAAQVYGTAPHHCYVWGGSGGGRRSPGNLEYGGDIWDGALPFMGGGEIDDKGVVRTIEGAQVMAFAAMFNTQRVLGDKLAGVVDAMAAGGSGNPYAGLTTHQREELANTYRLGFPRGDEFMLGAPMGQSWLWSSMADGLQETDADYFAKFWTEPGYVGHDNPEYVSGDVLNVETEVTRVLTAGLILTDPEFNAPQYSMFKLMSMLLAASGSMDLPVGVELADVPAGYRLGAGIRVISGAAAGRSLYCINHAGDAWLCDGVAENNILRFTGVEVGDKVQLDNRAFLAFCYYYRHHVVNDPNFDFLKVDGKPIYPQHPVPKQSPLMGVPYCGDYQGKLLWIHHTHDSSLWPPQGVVYPEAVFRAQGQEGLDERFVLQWTQNAEHIPVAFCPTDPKRGPGTWLIDYHPIIEQGLADLAAWCEQGIKPAGTTYEYADGKVTLPDTAAARGGVQPVVHVTANGDTRADVPVGQPVALTVIAETPDAGGTITKVEW
ncbi:MAG TPA: hypothetical protein VHE83_17235, partial [Mycobacteriales bacterium]|nr:hypothetical protein [Mycobacteriales bacterium]